MSETLHAEHAEVEALREEIKRLKSEGDVLREFIHQCHKADATRAWGDRFFEANLPIFKVPEDHETD